MSELAKHEQPRRVVEAVEQYNQFVLERANRRADATRRSPGNAQPLARDPRQSRDRHHADGPQSPAARPAGNRRSGEIARYLLGEGLPGEFPFVNGAYRAMYLEPLQVTSRPKRHSAARQDGRTAASSRAEEPTRLFAGLGLAEDTNARFHFLTQQQRPSASAPPSTGRRFTASTPTRRRLRQDRRGRRGHRHRR